MLFFRKVILPGLTHFIFDISDKDVPTTEIVEFRQRSSCPLKILNFHNIAIPADELIQAVKAVPTTTNFLFEPYFNQESLDDFHIAFCLTPPNGKPILPKLRRFFLETDFTFPWNLLPKFFQHCIDNPLSVDISLCVPTIPRNDRFDVVSAH